MTNGNKLMEQWAREQRAQNFQPTLEAVAIVQDAQLELRIGVRIGSGTTRDVFEAHDDQTRVVKRARDGALFANWTEYLIWSAARDTKWAPVLAQCFCISQSGMFLLMERVTAPITAVQYHRVPMLPWWINDLQPKNFGLALDNAIKVCDYAMPSLGFDMHESLPHRPGWAIHAR